MRECAARLFSLRFLPDIVGIEVAVRSEAARSEAAVLVPLEFGVFLLIGRVLQPSING